ITSPPRQMADLDSRIAHARHQARQLYHSLEVMQLKVQDATLAQVARDVASIPRNYSNLELYNTLKGHHTKVAQVQWSRDSASLLTASQDGNMLLWDAVTGFKRLVIRLNNPWVLTCAIAPAGHLAASGGLDNACTIYRVPSHAPYTTTGYETIFKGHTAYVSACEFVNDVSVLTASGDMSCALWDIHKEAKVRDFHDHLGDVLSLNYGYESGVFISGASDGMAKVWDPRLKGPTRSFAVSQSDVTSLASFPDGNCFVSGSDDGMVRWFDLRTDCVISSYSMSAHFSDKSPTLQQSDKNSVYSSPSHEFDNPGIISLDFSKSGRLLYVCYSDFGCMIWDTLKNDIIGTVGNDHMGKINQVNVSPDGIAVATASWDSTIKVWSV
ncbi:guanine nucleotide-binding protein, beta subunit, partial [Suhomyces tanzawaensis NRRL Y-17324]